MRKRGLESMLLRGFQSLASYVLQDGEEANDLKRAEAHFNAALKLGRVCIWFWPNLCTLSITMYYIVLHICSSLEFPNVVSMLSWNLPAPRKDSSSSPRARFGKAVLSAHRGDWQTALKSFREAGYAGYAGFSSLIQHDSAESSEDVALIIFWSQISQLETDRFSHTSTMQ